MHPGEEKTNQFVVLLERVESSLKLWGHFVLFLFPSFLSVCALWSYILTVVVSRLPADKKYPNISLRSTFFSLLLSGSLRSTFADAFLCLCSVLCLSPVLCTVVLPFYETVLLMVKMKKQKTRGSYPSLVCAVILAKQNS